MVTTVMEGANATTGDFIANNLIPVTIGNIFGGVILMGVVQWLYVRF